MNKTVILLILFLGLGLGTYFVLNKEDSNSSVDLTYDTDFKVDDIDAVHKIFIADRKGNATTLLKKNGVWYTKDGAKARKYPMDFVLKCLSSLEYKYLLSEPEGKFAVERMAISGIKVEVYDAADENLITFYIGPNANNHEGSYMMKEGSDKPQIMNIPGHVGELRTIFEMSGDQWKDRTVFEIEKSDIKSVEVSYPKQKSKSFRVTRNGKAINVVPVDKLTAAKRGEPNKSVVNAFLDEFESKIAESFKNELRGDSTLNTLPFATVKVEKTNGEIDELDFIASISKNTSSEGVPLTGKSNMMRYWTVKKGGDIYATQHHVMQGIFRSYDSFFP